MQGDPYASIIICSAPMVCATALLNANAFPKTVASEAIFAANRLAILLRNTNTVSEEIQKDAQTFFVHLNGNWQQYVVDGRTRVDLEFIAFSDGLGYMSSMHSVLYEFKAFLDLYARLICRLISPGGGPAGFNKGKVDGADISGGRRSRLSR